MNKITFLTVFLALLFLPIQLLGQEYIPLQVTTGFNSDVIAEAAPASETTTASVDAPSGGANFAFMTSAYPGATGGLPVNGLINSVETPELTFQLASYTGNNSLKINENGGTGTLVFGNQTAALNLFVLVTSGSATSTFTGLIHFTDNTTQVITSQSVSDWFQSGIVAIQGIGRVGRTGNNVENNATNPKIFQVSIPITAENSSKTIASIDFTKTSSNTGYLNIFGVSAEITPACPKPTNFAMLDVTENGASFNWLNIGSNFELKYGITGFDVTTTGTSVVLTSPNYSLTNVTAGQTYDVYIRRDCDIDGFSAWTGPLTFTAENVIHIGSGSATGTGGTTIPIANYNFNYSQQIVTASEYGSVGGGVGPITKIRYYVTNAGTTTVWNNWTVYIGNTTKSSFSSSSDWIPLAELTQVFSGTLTPSPTSGNWFEITFAEPFNYTGGNIVVAVDENTAGWSTAPTFLMYTSEANTGILIRSDGANPDPANPPSATSRESKLPQIRFVGTMASCPIPIELTATNIGDSEAALSWTSGGNSFDIKWGANGFDVTTEGTLVTSFTNGGVLSNLLSSTDYQFYVRRNCGLEDGLSDWSGPYSFSTLQIPATVPFIENFEGSISWTILNGAQTNKWVVGNATGNTGKSLYISNDNGVSNVYGHTTSAVHAYRDITIPNDVDVIGLSFDWKAGGESTYDYIRVWVTPITYEPAPGTQTSVANSGGVQIGEYFNLNTDFTTANFEIPAALYQGQTVRLIFEWKNDGGTGNTNPAGAIDNVNVFEVSCPMPTVLTATSIAQNSAVLGWTSEGDLFDVEMMLSTATATGVPTSTGVSNSFMADDLLAATTYKFYVRQNCGEGDVSVWVGPFSFTTACDLPDAATGITFTDVTATATKINYVAPSSAPTGYVIFRSTSNIPPVLTHGTTYSTSQFTAIGSLTTENEDTYYCVYNGTELLGTASNLTSNTEYHYYVFSRNSGNTCSGAPWYSATALTASQATAPVAPTSGVISGLTNSTATISWTASAVGGEAGVISYILEVYTDSGYTTAIVGSPFQIGVNVSGDLTGLATSTQYYYRIKANNTFGDSSYLTGSFTTTQVPATLNFVEDFEGTIAWSLNNGTATNKWHVGTASSTGTGTKSLYISNNNGVANTYTITSTSVVQAYRDIAVPLGTNMGSISFDWKGMGQDTNTAYDYFRVWLVPATFVPSSGSQISSGSGRIQVGSNFYRQTEWQDYENVELNLSSFAGGMVRVVFEWRNDSSLGSGDAAAIDNIELAIPACAAPTTLKVISLSVNSANLGWSSLGEDFDIKWGTPGFDVETEGTLVTDFANGGTLSNLTTDTSYQYYVRQNCGVADGVSLWSGPFSFTTLCNPIVDLPYTENFDTYGTGSDAFPDCWIRPVTFTSGSVVWPSIVTYESSNRLRFQSEVGIPTYAVSPAFAEDISNIRVGFKLKREGVNSGTLDIGVMSNPLDISTFELIQTISPNDNNFNDYLFYLDTTELSGSNKHIAFRHNSNLNNWYYWLDNLVIDKIPTCFPPLNIQVNNVDKNSAEVVWEAPELGNTPEDGYVIEIRTKGQPGDTVGFVRTVNTVDLTTILSELDPGTNYILYVKSLCTEDTDESIWSNGVSFTTLCDYADFEVVNVSDLSVCGSGSINIEVETAGSMKWYAAEDATTAIFTGNTYTTEVLTDTTSFWIESVRGADGVTVQVGTGDSTTNGDGSPFYHSYGGYKYQYTFTADELTASGLFEGAITALAFDVTQSATVNYSDFTIAIGTTTQSVATSTHVGGLTQVYSNASQTTPVGIHFYEFDTAFEWDGSSNVVVQVNWSNNNSGNYSASALVRAHTVSPSRTTMTRADNKTAAEILATMSGNVAGTSSGGTSAISRRPNTYFIGNAACFSPREEVVVTVAPTSEIEDVTISHTTGDTARVTIDSEGTSFEIEYGETGFEHGDGIVIAEAENIHTLTGLTDEVDYDVYVKNTCGEWFGPITFTSINIAMPQTITAEDVVKIYGDEPFINGSSDSELALSYVVTDSTVLNVVDGELVIVGAGTTEVVASQEGTENFLPAEEVTFTVTVNKTPLTVSVEDEEKVYDGVAYSSGTLSYEGFVYQDDATDLLGEAEFSGTGFGATDVGIYEVAVAGLISNNYIISYETGALEIVKATIEGIDFEDQILIYDGDEKSIYITGDLPSGVVVSYENNAKIEAGDYLVNASIDGGVNYNDLELEALMKIRKSLASVVFDNGTLVYNGSAQSIFVSDNVPTGVTVTYSNNAKTNVGVYEVVATLDGGDVYETVSLTATMTIEKATIQGVTLSDETFVYDGTARTLVIDGTLPEGVTVTYQNASQTQAGVYEVIASINGGANYQSFTLTATLTIEKASLNAILDFENATYTYDGSMKIIILSGELPVGVSATYTNNAHLEAGSYNASAIIVGGNNYEDLTLEAVLLIEKAIIGTVAYSDATFAYDGSVKTLVLSGVLPVGTSVVYSNNTHTAIGVYDATASIDGGVNYENMELSATMTIDEGIIPGVSFPNGYFTYDGESKSIYISGQLPTGASVTYVNNGKTEAGAYVVTALITGGPLYNDMELTANLVISKAAIPAIVFENGLFVYDGTAKTLSISGDLPAGASVSYQNNNQTNAGIYTVVANIDGGLNYVNLNLTAVMTIQKAQQVINFAPVAPILFGEDQDFQLTATASSNLPVRYNYTFTSGSAAAEVSLDGWLSIKHVGEIVVIASQSGNNNYHAAAPVEQVIQVVSKDVSIHELWIDNQKYSNITEDFHYVMDCFDLKSEVKIRVVTVDGALVTPEREFVIHAFKPGVYKQVITVTSLDGVTTKDYEIKIERPFSFDQIGVQKFNNSLLINNNPKTNGGYKFVGYQWFKNDVLVGSEQVYSAGDNELLDVNSVYHAVVTTEAGDSIKVCPMEVNLKQALRVQMYPNPVSVGGMTTLSIESSGVELNGIPVSIYNLRGQLIHKVQVVGAVTNIQLPHTIQGGVYLAVFELEGQQQTIKFIVE